MPKRKYKQSGPSPKRQHKTEEKNKKDKSNPKRKYKQSGPSPKKQHKTEEKNKKDKSNYDLTFEGMVDSLCSIFKCAVCLDVLQKDMVTCVNGHCICTKCYSKIQPYKLCPTCRGSFSNIKQNSLARHILDIILHTSAHC